MDLFKAIFKKIMSYINLIPHLIVLSTNAQFSNTRIKLNTLNRLYNFDNITRVKKYLTVFSIETDSYDIFSLYVHLFYFFSFRIQAKAIYTICTLTWFYSIFLYSAKRKER